MLSEEATKGVLKTRSADNIASRSKTSTSAVRAKIWATAVLPGRQEQHSETVTAQAAGLHRGGHAGVGRDVPA
jgi:hypothetical protein